ncbi:MAG: hypothetical protein ABEH43_06545 [Flavobacteriales bacterium]
MLEEEERGLSNEELNQLYEEKFEQWYGTRESERIVGNLVSQVDDMFLVDNRTVGLQKHLDISEEQMNDILDDLYSYYKLQKSPEFQARTEYIMEWVDKHYDISLTPHVLAEFMRRDERL